MAQTVKLKRTSVAGRNPTTSNIEVGELAFNSNDKSLFIRGDSDAIFPIYDSATLFIDHTNNRVGIGQTSPAASLHISTGHLLFNRGVELRSHDTGGNVRTIARVNGSNELEYGWSANAPVKFMGGGSYTERMRIHTNANIGINDIAPHGTLTVTGPRILVQRTNDDSSIAFANNACLLYTSPSPRD